MTESLYLLDKFVSTSPGEPYRLFPFGTIFKDGKKRTITPEVAAQFKLPHFRPAIKLGSHKDETPAGGHIVGLEVREDGLYAITELNDNGTTAIAEGHYKYQSPEVIWEGGFEDPSTGEIIEGPFIAGDALLHRPHLGDWAALYSVTEVTKDDGGNMTDQVTMPASAWEKIVERFTAKEEPRPEPAPPPEPDTEKYAALEQQAKDAEAQRDEYAAKLAAIEAEKKAAEETAAIVSTLQDADKYAGVFKDNEAATEAAKYLQQIDDEPRQWVLQQFAALTAQLDPSLTKDVGGSGADNAHYSTATQELDALIKAKMTADNMSYMDAFAAVRMERPELARPVYGMGRQQ